MQSTLYEPVQPWGGTQKPPSHRGGEAGALGGNSHLSATVALKSSDLRRHALLSVSSLSFYIFGGSSGGVGDSTG